MDADDVAGTGGGLEGPAADSDEAPAAEEILAAQGCSTFSIVTSPGSGCARRICVGGLSSCRSNPPGL